MDKLALKKRYKEEIREIIQQYLDRKGKVKVQTESRVQIPEKKENTKILKILEAIEKGKANIFSDGSK